MNVNGQVESDNDRLIVLVVTWVAVAAAWIAVVLGARTLWARPLGYLLGAAALAVCVASFAVERLPLAYVALGLALGGLVTSSIVVIVL